MKKRRNPTNEIKESIIKMLLRKEKELNMTDEYAIEFGIISLLRRQYARGDITQESLFHWLKQEGLM